MKHLHLSLYALCMLMSASLCMQPIHAEPEDDGSQEETADASEGDSKEQKRAISIAAQRLAADEFKAIRQLTNLLKKGKNDRDREKINTMADSIIQKYAAIHEGDHAITVKEVTITQEDLKPIHVKMGSQRKKLYKDFLDAREKQKNNANDNRNNNNKKKNKKNNASEASVSVDNGKLDKIKAFLRTNQEDEVNKLEERNEKIKERNKRDKD